MIIIYTRRERKREEVGEEEEEVEGLRIFWSVKGGN